jgi:hypothetical protein
MNTEKNKQPNLSKIIFFVSIEVSLFWILAGLINVYDFTIVGVFYEILWLPNLILLFALPLISLFFLSKEKKKLHSLFFYSILLLTITILKILITQ